MSAIVPQAQPASTRWTWRDHLGAARMRWRIGRSHYRVEPGLYAVGNPDATSPLLATANYKLSFDCLRRTLSGRPAWILVLDTDGINVWCAAGKGSFGTDELVGRMDLAGVGRVVGHRTLILPQLGAPGIAAHEVATRTGFRIVYGPVRADDLPAFLDAGMKASMAMRRVTFTLHDRLVLVPVEWGLYIGEALLVMLVLFLTAGLDRHGFRLAWAELPWVASAVWINYFAGLTLVPALLPWLPGRAFSAKGAVIGLLTGTGLCVAASHGLVEKSSVMLLSLSACSFLGLMFTGSTPYTSMSGVRKEMARALPLQLAGAVAGLVLWVVARFMQEPL
jgi:hypothetical protein